MVESFFATPKEELVYQRAWPTRHELEMEVVSYIEGFYNSKRRHSRLDNLSPATTRRSSRSRGHRPGVRLTGVTSVPAAACRR